MEVGIRAGSLAYSLRATLREAHSRRKANTHPPGERYNGRVQFNSMSKINWSRLLLCGLLTGIAWIILGAVVTTVLGRDLDRKSVV